MNSIVHLELAIADAKVAHARCRQEEDAAFDAYMKAGDRTARAAAILDNLNRQYHDASRLSRFVALHNPTVGEAL